jgi:hypothetical protein
MVFSSDRSSVISPRWRERLPLLFHAVTMGTFLAASSTPTPLYRVYQEMWGLSAATITVIFGIYALALLVGLLVFGSASDHVGRRPVIALALVLNIGAIALFALAGNAVDLMAARALQGFATGLGTSTLGAALIDDDPDHGPLANSIAPLLGMSLGSLGSGLLIDIAPYPLMLGYLLMGLVMALEAVALWLAPETAPRRPGLLRSMRPVIAVPVQARRTLLFLTLFNVNGWALAGLFLSLGPAIVKQASGLNSLLIGGGIVASLNLSGAVAILFVRHWPVRRQIIASASFSIVGISFFLLGLQLGSVLLMFLGTLTTGIGFGPAFLATVRTLGPLAKPHERGGLMAAFLTESYLAFSLPSLAAGVAVGSFGLVPVAEVYGLIIIASSLVGTMLVLRKVLA